MWDVSGAHPTQENKGRFLGVGRDTEGVMYVTLGRCGANTGQTYKKHPIGASQRLSIVV